jgi:hypothetical protein
MNGAATTSQSAVLMARIVDASGRSVSRADIVSIRYSILEVNASRPNELTAVAGHDRVPLEVDAVFHDWLEFGELWSVDDEGYNFRHEIVWHPTASFPKPHAHYQVVYELTSVAGDSATIRFALKVS